MRTVSLIASLALVLPACHHELANTRLSSQDAAVNSGQVNSPAMRALEIDVIKAVRERYPAAQQSDLYLLKGSDYSSYSAIAGQLGSSPAIPENTTGKEPLYAIRSVALDANIGVVSVAHPGTTSPVAIADVRVEYRQGAWRVTGITERPMMLHSGSDVPVAERAVAEKLAQGAKPPVKPEWYEEYVLGKKTDGAAKQPKPYNWAERNLLGKKTEEQKAAKAEAKAKKEAEEKAAAELEAKKEAEAKSAPEAQQPNKYNWFQRNILGRKTDEQKAAEAEAKSRKEAEDKAAAEMKAQKEAEEKAAKETKKAEEKSAKEAAAAQEKAPAQEKPAAEVQQPKKYNWFQRNILGRKTDEQKAAEAEAKSKKEAEDKAAAEVKAQKEAEEKAAKEAKKAEEKAAADAKAAQEENAAKEAKAAQEKAAAEAKPAAEAKQPKKYNWFQRNILGRKTDEQKAEEVAEKAKKDAQQNAEAGK